MSQRSRGSTKTDAQAKTWLKPEGVEALRDACLSAEVPTYLQDRNEALVALLYDTGLRREEAALLDVDNLDLARRELRLGSTIQKDDPPEAMSNSGSGEQTPRGSSGGTSGIGGRTPQRCSRVGSQTG